MQITNHRLDGVPFVASPNVSGFIIPEFVVMHYTAGWTSESAIKTLTDPAAKVSAHLVIGREGDIHQLVPFNRNAWHAGPSAYHGVKMMNGHSIGIELVNPGWLVPAPGGYQQGKTFFPVSKLAGYDLTVVAPNKRLGGGNFVWPGYAKAQIDALDKVFAAICGNYAIQDVVSHEEIDTRGWKTDPGPAFPMGRYKTDLHQTTDRSGGEKRMKSAMLVGVPKLNVRTQPNAKAPVVAILNAGTEVVIVEDEGLWSLVEFRQGQCGYLADQYLKKAA